MDKSLQHRCAALVEALGIAPAADVAEVTPLTGGVASDIARVRVGDRDLCVKFALPKLKVAAEWHAPVHRNAAEYAWLSVAAQVCPETAVRLFGRSEDLHGFAMEFLTGNDVYLWKAALLAEHPDRGEAGAVGDLIGRIHAASTGPDFDTTPFRNQDDFHALRCEPYLTHMAPAHPDIAPRLHALSDGLHRAGAVLVHGDVSPKNILFRASGPVILDAECATMGDPAFDPAFCLNHLVLKSVHLPRSRASLLSAIGSFWSAYEPHVTWEPPADLERRTAHLLPALMLGRIDGKSPVEYLSGTDRAFVRNAARDLIINPSDRLEALVARLSKTLKERSR